MSLHRFETLDELAAEFSDGESLRFEVSGHSKAGRVLGYVYSLPLEPGGRDEPALVVALSDGTGHVYPHEVTHRSKRR